MRKLALVLGVSIIFSGSALAQVIDPEWKATQQRMKQEEKKSCSRYYGKARYLIERAKCESVIDAKYKRNGDVPGTREYIEKKYSRMSRAELNQFILDYHDKYFRKCRSLGSYETAEPGEITYEIFDQNSTLLNELLDSKGGAPNPYEKIFGKGTSFGSTQHW